MPRARHSDTPAAKPAAAKGIVVSKPVAIMVILLLVGAAVGFSFWYLRHDLPPETASDPSEEIPEAPSGELTGADGAADAWPAAGLQKLWERKVGLGFSTPVALGNTLYVMGLQGDQDRLAAVDAATGDERWAQAYTVTVRAAAEPAANPDNKLPIPCAPPTIEAGIIYTYGGGGDLTCRDLTSGAERWRLNVLRETRSGILQWNEGSAPLVDAKYVYVQAGKGGPTAVAVDKTTGKIAWQSQARTVAGYAAPILVNVDNVRQLIIFAGDALYGMNPDTGKTIWQEPWSTNWNVNATTPIFRDGRVFVSSEYGQGSMMLQLTPTGAKREWKSRKMQAKFQPLVWGEGNYLFANNANFLSCMRWPDGEVLWTARDRDLLEEGGSFIRDGKNLIVLSGKGKLSLVRASDRGYKVLSQFQALEGDKNFASPLVYEGRLYLKGKDTLVCYALPAKK